MLGLRFHFCRPGLFFRSCYPAGNGIHRAGVLTFSATDTLQIIAVLYRITLHLANRLTSSAVDALLMIQSITEKGHGIKERINRAQGADILTEGAVNDHGKEDGQKQNQALPCIEKAYGSPHTCVHPHQRNPSLQHAHGTNQFTEIGGSLSYDIH